MTLPYTKGATADPGAAAWTLARRVSEGRTGRSSADRTATCAFVPAIRRCTWSSKPFMTESTMVSAATPTKTPPEASRLTSVMKLSRRLERR